jgi:hypothetical protein
MHLREAAAHGLNYAYELTDLETLSAGSEILPQLFDVPLYGLKSLQFIEACMRSNDHRSWIDIEV